MADKILDVVVKSYDPNTMFAKLVDSDKIEYELFAAAHFGGDHNLHPKVGESLRVRYGRMGRGGFDKGIIECWRPKESAVQ